MCGIFIPELEAGRLMDEEVNIDNFMEMYQSSNNGLIL